MKASELRRFYDINRNISPKSNFNVFKHLTPYIKPYKKKFILIIITLALSSVLNLIPALLMGIAIDNYFINKNGLGILLITVAIILLGFALGITNFLQNYTSQFVGQSIVRDIRRQVFEHTSKLSFQYFDKTKTGDLISRIIVDSDRLQRIIVIGFSNIFVNVLLLIGVLIVMFVWNIYFGFIFLTLIPFIIWSMFVFSNKIRPYNRQARKINSYLTSVVEDSLNGFREVKLYGREEFMEDNVNSLNTDYLDSKLTANKYSSFWVPFIPLLLNASICFILIIGGISVSNGKLQIGLLVAAITYFGQLSQPIRSITRFLNMYNMAQVSGERIFELLKEDNKINEVSDAIEMQEVKGKVEIQNVTFSYEPGNEILKDVSFDILPGQMVAVIGPSGVGKTTLLHLIPRFYEAEHGKILVDNHDIKEFSLNSLRKNIGIVMQTTFLFDGTLKDNITYACPDISMEEIKRASKIAQLDEFIESLPKKYDTPIGERGVRLSGGQAQRLSLARVIITNPKILILDEPTAQVDAITDRNLMNAVRKVMKGRTTLVIAHRLWTIQHADKIILLKDGEIEAIGTHNELMEESGFYKEFFASQFQTELKSEENAKMKEEGKDKLKEEVGIKDKTKMEQDNKTKEITGEEVNN